MSIQTIGSQTWTGFIAEPDTVCFLCGKILEQGEQVIHWMGAGGPECDRLPFTPNDADKLLIMDELLKRGGMAPALDICFHPNCVPSFCRRILQDWERIMLGK